MSNWISANERNNGELIFMVTRFRVSGLDGLMLYIKDIYEKGQDRDLCLKEVKQVQLVPHIDSTCGKGCNVPTVSC